MYKWYTGKPDRIARDPGTPGVFVTLCDWSGSMWPKEAVLEAAFSATQRAYPDSHVVVFGEWAADWRPRMGINSVGGGTFMERGIDYITPLRPEKTLIISDGGALPFEPAFAAAERLTGAIDTLFCCYGDPSDLGDAETRDRDFMIELARRGGGQMRYFELQQDWRVLFDLIQQSYVLNGTVYHHYDLPPLHVHQGAPAQQTVRAASPLIRRS